MIICYIILHAHTPALPAIWFCASTRRVLKEGTARQPITALWEQERLGWNIKIPHSGRLLYGNWAIWGILRRATTLSNECVTWQKCHINSRAHNGALCEKLILDFRSATKISAKRFQRACSSREAVYCLNDDTEKTISGVTIYVNSELFATCVFGSFTNRIALDCELDIVNYSEFICTTGCLNTSG